MTAISILDAAVDLGSARDDVGEFCFTSDGCGSACGDEFELDMSVVESTTPLVTMLCATSDGCGSSCSTSACSTGSNDPI